MKIGKHLFVEEQNPKRDRKTKIFEICAINNNLTLGTVHYHAHWRQYVFQPIGNTIYSASCILDIQKFIINQNTLHKLKVIEERENK